MSHNVIAMRHRTVLHVNTGSFPALIEQKRVPELASRPVIVAVPRGNTTGIVASASGEAELSGAKQGMVVRRALRACPEAVVVRYDRAVYIAASNSMLDQLSTYTPHLEPDGLGSAYMDVTGCRRLFGSLGNICRGISDGVMRTLGLPVYIGCASNKLVAKMASGVGKPFVCVKPGFEQGFLAGLDIGTLPAVTPRIDKRLRELGVTRVGELAAIPEKLLVRQFGEIGVRLRMEAIGIDFARVKSAYPPDVIIIEHLLEYEVDEPPVAAECLGNVACEAGARLRKRNLLASEVTLELRAGLGQPAYTPASARFKTPTDSPHSIRRALEKLLYSRMQEGVQIYGVRAILSDLVRGQCSQLSLIGERERGQRIDHTMDIIRERFGDGAIDMASHIIKDQADPSAPSDQAKSAVAPRIALSKT